MPVLAPDRETVLAELGRILSWPEVARSPQLGRFLDYIVRRTLDGDEQAIKAYSIAVDVFGRSTEFDPQADPIVRVQARRLRALLEQYYDTAGAGNTLRITLPVGRYVPEFSSPKAGVEPDRGTALVVAAQDTRIGWPSGLTRSWLALLLVAVGLAALGYGLASWEPRQRAPARPPAAEEPSIAIMEFQDLAGAGGNRPVVAGLALELVTDLEAFEDIDARYGGEDAEGAPERKPSDFMLTGIVRRAEQAVQYSAILTETVSGAVVWSRTIAVDEVAATQAEELDAISRALSLVLGSPRGPLHLPARRLLQAGQPIGDLATDYICHLSFDIYREAATAANGERAVACYAALPESSRQAPTGLAALASLLAEQAVGAEPPELSDEDRVRISGTMLARAINVAPLSGFVWEQQARWLEGQGRIDAASAAYASSLQLNPANAEALAALARLKALQGDLVQAEPLSNEVMSGSPMPPAWYFGVPALLALHQGRLSAAISNAQTYASADPELGSVLAVTAAWQSDNSRVVNRYLPQVLEVASFKTAGILPRLRKRIGDTALLAQIGSSLSAAGVPQRALTEPF